MSPARKRRTGAPAGISSSERGARDLPVLDLQPFMAKHEIGLAVLRPEGAVQAFPAGGRRGAVRKRDKRAQRGIGTQNLRAPTPARRDEAAEQIVFPPPDVHFGRPIVAVRPKARRLAVKDDEGAFKMLEIARGIGGKKTRPPQFLRPAPSFRISNKFPFPRPAEQRSRMRISSLFNMAES